MLNDFDIVAISSLESPHHAENKVPNIVSVSWSLGRRCNYDCSYCGSDIHDNFSSHISLENVKQFTNNLNEHYASLGKRIKFNITGGEPYVHPQILEILEHIHSLSQTEQIVVVTNGSLPLELYIDSLEFINNLTVSLHLERSIVETYSTLTKINLINKHDVFLNVNLMALPGQFDLVKSIIEKLNEHTVLYVLRGINPRIDYNQEIVPIGESGMERHVVDHENYDAFYDENRKGLKEKYYSKDELAFLDSHTNNKWQNIRVHTEDGYTETNTDELNDKGLNKFKGWTCFAGVDSLYIDFDGNVYKSWCLNEGKIGHITEHYLVATKPTICQKNVCSCNTDLVIRKCKSKEQLPIII